MYSQPKERVFISWTGELGKEVAECLSEDKVGMLSFAQLEPWISGKITKGSSWFQSTQEALESSKYGVVCLMPGSSRRPWINFEAGFLFGRLKNCKLVTFGENLANPLGQLQKMNGLKMEDWITLLTEMTAEYRTPEECRDRVQRAFPRLKEILDRRDSFPHRYPIIMDQKIGDIQRTADELKRSDIIRNNDCIQQVILESYKELENRFIKQSIYTAPASQYPRYLISLQRRLSATVKAIALVNIEEEFWQQELGKEILRTSSNKSVRIFVFTSEKHWFQMSEILKNHALRYQVYAISYPQLSKEFSLYTKDFSIIESSNGKLLAEYDIPEGVIQFNADPDVIDEHESIFEKIIRHSVVLPQGRLSDNELNQIKDRVFNASSFELYESKTIEMSKYIHVEDYDRHEENHAYYREMMDHMIEIFLNHYPSSLKPYRVLEFGAGTGIFTSRLAQVDRIHEIVAVEIDWHCFNKLKYKFKDRENRITVLHEDSRIFDPPGKFDCIFSSFADHHIRERDKAEYFRNVKRNLKPGGLLIVGDEFLRAHNEENWKEALEAYHNHIIEKAREIGDEILVHLETQALRSGLEKLGDFKVSCERYKELLQQSGFAIEKEELIGPKNKSQDIGGVYVYAIRHVAG